MTTPPHGPSAPEKLTSPCSVAEPLLTLKDTAKLLGVPYFKLQRAARTGVIPTYRIYNSRRLVRLSEVIAVIDSTRQGGGDA